MHKYVTVHAHFYQLNICHQSMQTLISEIPTTGFEVLLVSCVLYVTIHDHASIFSE